MRYAAPAYIGVISHFFFRVGKFPRVLVFAGHLAASRASDAITNHPSRGLGST